MYFHATGTIPDLEKLGPHLEEETQVVTKLAEEGVIKGLFRLTERSGVYMIVEADDLEDARKQVGRMPFVINGLLSFEFEPVEKLL
ncbi:MAG: hypothetical protein JWR83_1376 [Aeromicrobium sp.]|nr:hypothetical protein [Aeromicrobium sp.]